MALIGGNSRSIIGYRNDRAAILSHLHGHPTGFTAMFDRVDALIVHIDAVFQAHEKQIVALAAKYAVPTMYANRQFTPLGGLISYGTDPADGYRQAGVYVGRILKGAKPADLPVVQADKFELVVNLKTAKSLGLKIPDSFLLLADEVIE